MLVGCSIPRRNRSSRLSQDVAGTLAPDVTYISAHFIILYVFIHICINVLHILCTYIYCIEKSFCVCRLSQDISRCIAFSNIIFEFNFVTHFSTFYNYITSHKFFLIESICSKCIAFKNTIIK